MNYALVLFHYIVAQSWTCRVCVKSLMLKAGEIDSSEALTCRGTRDRDQVQTEQAEEKHAIRHDVVLLEVCVCVRACDDIIEE